MIKASKMARLVRLSIKELCKEIYRENKKAIKRIEDAMLHNVYFRTSFLIITYSNNGELRIGKGMHLDVAINGLELKDFRGIKYYLENEGEYEIQRINNYSFRDTGIYVEEYKISW